MGRTTDDAPRKMPAQEREARKDQLQARLKEIQCDFANTIIDMATSMIDNKVVRRIPWDRCPTRAEEIAPAGVVSACC